MTIKDIIELVEAIKKPEKERLELLHGVMSDGYVMACDDIINELNKLDPNLSLDEK